MGHGKHRPRRLLPNKQVCARYGVSEYTVYRWDRKPGMNFPNPVLINGKLYRYEHELDEFDERHRFDPLLDEEAERVDAEVQRVIENFERRP
jgi:predicted DNA-binding transcriptional regulator AlpA